jgi:hypothetical protein
MLRLLEHLSFHLISDSNPDPGPQYYSWSAKAKKVPAPQNTGF